jgi:hypothetical protein
MAWYLGLTLAGKIAVAWGTLAAGLLPEVIKTFVK